MGVPAGVRGNDGVVTGSPMWGASGHELAELDELLGRPAWHAQAACRSRPEVDFFPPKGRLPTEALEVCLSCPVRADCRDWALEQGYELIGVWGGLSTKERIRLLRRRRAT